jgi:large subunit ribosomal protein L20
MSYSQLINGLNKAEIEINRKMLADIAVNDLEQFEAIVNEAKAALGVKATKAAKKVEAEKPAKEEAPAAKEEVKEEKAEEAKEEE